MSELESPASPGILLEDVSGDPNIVEGRFDESPLPSSSAVYFKGGGCFFLRGVDVTGPKVNSSSVVVEEEESVTVITCVLSPVITCVADEESNPSIGWTSVPKYGVVASDVDLLTFDVSSGNFSPKDGPEVEV